MQWNPPVILEILGTEAGGLQIQGHPWQLTDTLSEHVKIKEIGVEM